MQKRNTTAEELSFPVPPSDILAPYSATPSSPAAARVLQGQSRVSLSARYFSRPALGSLRGKSSVQNFSSRLGSVPELGNSLDDAGIGDEGLFIEHSVGETKVSERQFVTAVGDSEEQTVPGVDWHRVHNLTSADVKSPLLHNSHEQPANLNPNSSMSQHSRSSSAAPSIFDDHHLDHHHNLEDQHQPGIMAHYSTSPTIHGPSGEDGTSYDLKPPPPSQPLSNIELLHDRLFSADHLKLIIRDHTLYSRFSSFLTKYRPHASQALARYVESQKAVAAVDYANAIADTLIPGNVAALLDEGFEESSRQDVDELVNDALPGYVTHRLVQVVTETLVKEITGQNMPVMRELVNGLAEVYCLTDPSLPDNPIVYASEEFYRTSQYGKDYVIGRNCRFLQGPRSSGATVSRLVEALAEGQEICETILNYRRDGSPFMNLLLIAPLYDNKGTVRYFIGAQIDINGLIENGRGLDSFERLLAQDRQEARYGDRQPAKTPQAALAELSNMLNDIDMEIVRHSGREMGERRMSGASTPSVVVQKSTGRRYVGMDDPTDRNLWPAPSFGPSGRLPGVFQNYLLVRPYPSLRITFTSPALRIPGLLQSRFLDHIGGAPHIREGILSAMSSGVGVTAKVTWIPTIASELSRGGSVNSRDGQSHARHTSEAEGKVRWIHCTPLLGSDEKVGVWMVVMVESEYITGSIHSQQQQQQQHYQQQRHNVSSNSAYAPDRGNVTSPVYASTSSKLYNQYLRREGRNDSLVAIPGKENQFPGAAGSRQSLNNPAIYAQAQSHGHGQGQNTASNVPSKQSSTRSRAQRNSLSHPLHSPTTSQTKLAQSPPPGIITGHGSTNSQPYEIRAGPYPIKAQNSVSSAINAASPRFSIDSLNNSAGYGPMIAAPQQGRQEHGSGAGMGYVDRDVAKERDVYERSRQEKEAKRRESGDRAVAVEEEAGEGLFQGF